jgi:large subunit ribosomal protein L24
MKIKNGDKVKILKGKDAGKTGKVIQVMKNKSTEKVLVVVEGVNLLKKHLRSGKQGEKGQIIELPSPMNISNVMLIDAKSGKPTRVGFKMEGTEKKRVAKVSGEIIH